ncbi:MAG: NADH-quinone oxidoreductase subunit NuoE [Gammaproteobacteria bacterium]
MSTVQTLISPATLSTESRKQIDQWLKKFPSSEKQSAVIAALHIVQDENGGWLSNELIEGVAQYLQMPKIAVYEVATFYTMFELKPTGKHKIYLCTNVSCMLCGCGNIADHLKQKLGIDFNETSTDGQFTLKAVECLAACGGAPMMQIGKTYYENLTPEKVDHILAGLD